MALAVPLSRFTSRVGRGSAFYVRPMWVKRTPDELAKLKHQRLSSGIRGGIFMAIVVTVVLAFCYGGISPSAHGRLFVPVDAAFDRLPSAVIFGVVVGVIYFVFSTRADRRVICPSCGTMKSRDGDCHCKCGGHFEKGDDLKWHDQA